MEIKQQMKLSQQLVMTPQLQQAIKLLQLSRLELIDEIRKELDANPVLSDEEVEPRPREAGTSAGEAAAADPESIGDTSRLDKADVDMSNRAEDKKAQEVDWEQFLENRTLQQPLPSTRGGFEELPPIEQNLTRPANLHDHLMWQLQMADFTDAERRFAELVVGSLDENGFLDIGSSYRETLARLERDAMEDPASKYATFNVGIIFEKLGEHARAASALRRFLGVDVEADERARGERLAAAIASVRGAHDALVSACADLGQSSPPAQRALSGLRAKPAPRSAYRDAVRALREARPEASQAVDLDAVERGLDHLAEADPRAPSPARAYLADAVRRSLVAERLDDALAIVARWLGRDVEPHEIARATEMLAELDAKAEAAVPARQDLCLEYLAEDAGLDPEDAPEVLRMLQEFDPVGVCSRDLRECLRVQAEVRGYDELELAIIDRHLHNLEKHNYQAIARDLKVPVEEVYEAAQQIQELESRPARNFTDTDDKTIAITPDVYVIKDGDRFVVLDNDRGVQRLYINDSLTKQMLRDPHAKEFINDKLRNAQWLIRAIEQRRKTIIRVTECIVEKQRDFFERGVAHLKPMILRDVADAVDMHESTISRVTTNKYVHTPQGLFELKYFFNSSIRRTQQSGQADDPIASESVKQAIKKLIDEEDKLNPLSDQTIVEMLESNEGINIARRTVAKYREMLGILASSKRKKLF